MVFLLPNHIQCHTQHHYVSLMYINVPLTMPINILQNRRPIASIDVHIHPLHST